MTRDDMSGDRLRDLLRSEAATIVPAGDGLARIRERIARRRRARLWVVPSAALATAAAVGAFFLLTPDTRRTATLQPGQTPSTSAPEPSTSHSPIPVVPDDGGMPLEGAAIWPFTSQAQASQWSQEYPYAQNGLEVGRHFVSDFLGLEGVSVSEPCVSCGALELDVNGSQIGSITLARVGVGFAGGHGTQVYTVVRVRGLDLTIDSPKPGAGIASPTSVSGRAGQPDEHVALRLLSQAGKELASGGAQAGREVPWSTSLSWSSESWTHGAIVGVTRSAKDGALSRVVAVPVTRGTTPSDPTSSATAFAGIVDGHVAVFDGLSGKQERQLTFPPSGKRDVAAAWSDGTLAWVRTAGASVCVDELDRLVNGKASTLVRSTSAHLVSPRLSQDGSVLAYVSEPCNGGKRLLTVTAPGVPNRVVSAGSSTLVDVRNDGSALVWSPPTSGTGGGTLLLSRPEDGSSLGSRAFRPDSGCAATPAAAFVEGGLVAFEDCNGTVRLVHVDASNRITARDRAISTEPPQSLSSRGGALLVQLFGGDTYGSVARYANGTFTTIITNDSPSCTSTGSGKGCVASPDW